MRRDEIVAAGVAGAAFIASAQHIFAVCADAGNFPIISAMHPAGIDGLIYIGIRAMQKKRKVAGALAIGYGAAYSLAFNAAAYGAFKMPSWALAACMPLAMALAFLIVHGSSDHEPRPLEDSVTAAREKTDVVLNLKDAPAPRPSLRVVRPDVVPTGTKLLPIVPRVRPSVPEVKDERPTRKPRTDGPSGAGTRVAAWDVEKAVRLLREGRTNEEVAGLVSIGEKPIQRTKRALGLILGSTHDDEIIGVMSGLSAAHVARVRAAVLA